MKEEYIKRKDAIRAVSKVDDYGDGVGYEVRSHALVELELLPSVYAVEANELIEFLKHMAWETAINCVGAGAVYEDEVFKTIAEYRLDLWYEAFKTERKDNE